MEIKIVHVSDIHFAVGCAEKRPAFLPFLQDLERQVKQPGFEHTYLALTGDVAQAGSSKEQYQEFLDRVDNRLTEIGIPRARRICVPGNHDVDTGVVSAAFATHESSIARVQNESEFNDFIESPPTEFLTKFLNYLEFQGRFAEFGISATQLGGRGFTLPEGIGVFCMNSAFFSSGGALLDGQRVKDEKRLCIATREMSDWLETNDSHTKILLSHHPVSWLAGWCEQEMRRLGRRVRLILSGHMHDQNIHHNVEFGANVVQLHAPALLTNKRDPMGYSITTICADRGPLSVRYRQWGKLNSFVSGTLLSDSDSGEVNLVEVRNRQALERDTEIFVERFFEAGLEKALQAFGNHPRLWISPIIKRISEKDRTGASPEHATIRSIIESAGSVFIKAPPQYGLSCLGWAICRDAARTPHKQLWLRIDLSTSKPHRVRDELAAQLKTFGKVAADVRGIVVDGWRESLANSTKVLEAISAAFSTARMIVLQTLDRPSLDAQIARIGSKEFEHLYLWALPRKGIREVVRGYCGPGCSVDRHDLVTTKVVSDLDALNLPRTVLNCLTLLMVSEVEYDDSPINRAEVIKKVLFLVFSVHDVPSYKAKPDLKDCEHLLGCFVERMVRGGEDTFSREQFIGCGAEVSRQMLVDVDGRTVLELLLENGIVVSDESGMRFRFAYWVHYFTAVRMHHSADFAAYILSDMRYTSFPEVIEFYTGIDRRRSDALTQLTGDLNALCDEVESKCQLASPSDLYSRARWNPSDADIEVLREIVVSQVLESRLPDEIKDQFADRSYDSGRPYEQQVHSIMTVYSFNKLTAGLRAGARALRNSDFVDPDLKKALLRAIMRCWEQVQTVVVLASPSLARTGVADFDGTRFTLGDGFEKSKGFEHLLGRIWSVIPGNVLGWFREDLSSAKMGALISAVLSETKDPLTKHNLVTLAAAFRPAHWKSTVEDYIADVSKNSFFLANTFELLLAEYQYASVTDRVRAEVAELVKKTIAKHRTGNDRPGARLVGDVPNSVLGKVRDAAQED